MGYDSKSILYYETKEWKTLFNEDTIHNKTFAAINFCYLSSLLGDNFLWSWTSNLHAHSQSSTATLTPGVGIRRLALENLQYLRIH